MTKQKIRVAIIDDEPGITDIFSEYLRVIGDFEIETFNDSVDALVRLQQQKFDVISLDYRIPKLTGLDLIRILRTSSGLNKDTRILLVSGYTEDVKKYTLDNHLMDDVLIVEKPVDEENYIRYIKFMLPKQDTK